MRRGRKELPGEMDALYADKALGHAAVDICQRQEMHAGVVRAELH